VPQVEGALHVDPKLWTVSAVGTKPNRHLGRDGTLLSKNLVQLLPADAHLARRIGNAHPQYPCTVPGAITPSTAVPGCRLLIQCSLQAGDELFPFGGVGGGLEPVRQTEDEDRIVAVPVAFQGGVFDAGGDPALAQGGAGHQ